MRHKMIFSMVVAGMVVSMISMLALAGGDKGNGTPSGKHYNLNIIGVPNAKNVNFDGGEGSRIFVLRTGSTQFYVHGGTSYQILDHDGTDGKVGSGLEDPGIIFPYDANKSPTWRVDIYVRLLGPKGSEANWTSYYYDAAGDAYVLYDTFHLDKSSKFSLRTNSLLADGYQDMLWVLDPVTKFRLCQMRIFLIDE
jgi:hypothetical protein